MPDPVPEQVIAAILEQLEISRVVTVDDDYAAGRPTIDSGSLWSQLSQMPAASVFIVLGAAGEEVYSPDPDVFEHRFRRHWETASDEDKNQLHLRLKDAHAPKELENAEDDLTSAERIPILFGRLKLMKMNLVEWRRRAAEIYETSDAEPTLILFDRDFQVAGVADDVGLDLVREALSQPHNKSLVCCLVSHLFHEKTLIGEWEEVSQRIGIPQSKVIPIPKEILRPKPLLVATLIKLAAVAPHYDKMRERVLEITQDCTKDAHKAVSSLNYVDLDRMIFKASDKEGVWEPDTLFRAFGISLRTETRKRVITDAEMRDASAFIRRVSRVATPPGGDEGNSVWKFNRAENYEESDSLNALHRPTDLGDIYAKGSKRYVLLAPPCDLMVRTAQGYRGSGGADAVKEVILAEISNEDPSGMGKCIDFFNIEKSAFVNFKKTVSVRLLCLDLCVLNSDGTAKLALGDSPSQLLIPAWEKRHGIMREELERLLTKFKAFDPLPKHREQIARLLTRADNLDIFTGTLSLETSSIELNFRRIARLLPPRSTALVKAYCEFLNRDAFEHTFGHDAVVKPSDEARSAGSSDAATSQAL